MLDKEKLKEIKHGKKSGVLYIFGKEKLTMDDFPKFTKIETKVKEEK